MELINPPIEKVVKLEHSGWVLVSAVKDIRGKIVYTYTKPQTDMNNPKKGL